MFLLDPILDIEYKYLVGRSWKAMFVNLGQLLSVEILSEELQFFSDLSSCMFDSTMRKHALFERMTEKSLYPKNMCNPSRSIFGVVRLMPFCFAFR